MEVEVAGASGAVERVGVTADHPWFVVRGEGALEWVQTLDLKPGDHLVTADGRDGFVQTYNLEVADFHTFLVGKHGVVVHNCNRAVKEALRQLRTNREFRRWFHREYKPGQKIGTSDQRNPDLPPEDVLEAWQTWLSGGR